jgi:Domain of unknown function (DUF5011)
MRKILLVAVLAALAYAGCKKKENDVSTTVTASYPIITINGSQYVTISVGGTFTPPSATAVDTFYHEKPTVVTDLGTLDNTVPGLYTVTYSAKNHYGFVGTKSLFVAVTNINDTLDLSGWYIRNLVPGRVAFVTKLSRGMFMTSNVGGVDTGDATTGAKISAVFAVTSLSSFTFGSQLTSGGNLTSSLETLGLAPADTTLNYSINLAGFGTQIRTFVKQP